MKSYYVYIIASNKNGTLYIGITNNLLRRMYEHRNEVANGFSKKYSIKNLVYYEQYSDVYEAITREKQLKKWNRAWKIELIEKSNPKWQDLYAEIF